MNDFEENWWLMYSSFPDLNWARLRVFQSGKSEVFDMDGKTSNFVSKSDAINSLLEDEYISYNAISPEDEIEYDINLKEIEVPKSESDVELVGLMYRQKNA